MSGRLPDQHVRLPLSLQRWESLALLHWRYPAQVLRGLVDPELEVQEIDGSAWVGVVPFVTADLRAPLVPAVPGWSTFPEVNVRTYVRTRDGVDGIWFLRVHCARRLVVAGFRALGLPYWHEPGRVEPSAGRVRYRTPAFRATVRAGDAVEQDELLASLAGRWNAFMRRGGRLWRVPVEHEPWSLREAQVQDLDVSLLGLAGLPLPYEPPLVHVGPRVHARIGAPRPAA